ncbi:MAG: hypothetical protein HLX51_07840 [Micrococcaceae bacterium]|nr:hypothetical protein [Micrococcaceae bacterium]
MASNLHHAMHVLHQTGQVYLPGAPVVWTDTAKNFLLASVIFASLIGVLGLGGFVFAVITAVVAGSLALFLVFGIFSLFPVVFAVLVWLNYLRLQRHHPSGSEFQPVIIDARGLTMRGVGPIAWDDFLPPRYKIVSGEMRGSQTRAVLPLTASGVSNLNSRLPSDVRNRLSPPGGLLGRRPNNRYMYVPGVDGLTPREMMDLLTAAYRVYGKPRA